MDWRDLPGDLLHLISRKLHRISDLIHFRGVCTTWRASASIDHLPPQIPCLLVPPDPGTTTLQFYSLTSGAAHAVHVPQLCDQTILGSFNGFFLTRQLGHSLLSLYNPVTNSKLSLPFVKVTRPWLIWASSNPVQNEDFAVCIFGNLGNLDRLTAFWRHGDLKWTTVNNGSLRSCYDEENEIYAVLYRASNLTAVYDVLDLTIPEIALPPPGEEPFCPRVLVYLIPSDGELLRVVKHDDKFSQVDQCRFDIYKLDVGDEKEVVFWVKISSIGDQVLFLNLYNGFSVTASCFDGLRGNSIYFFKEVDTPSYGGNCLLSRYDIEAGTAEILPFPCMMGGMWFQRSIQYM